MKIIKNSLARKIYLHFILIGSVVFTGIGVILHLFSMNYANLALEVSMKGMSEDVADALRFEQQQLIYAPDSVIEKWGYDALYNNFAFRVIRVANNEVLLQSVSNDQGSAALEALTGDIPVGYSHLAGVDRFRTELTLNGQALVLDMARNDLITELANEAVIPALNRVTAITIFAAFGVFMLVGYLSVRSVVQPVKTVAGQLKQIKPEQLSFRLSNEGLPYEIQPIVNSLNQAMERVEAGFDEQKRFVANAAHELKTPLAVLNTRVQLADIAPQIREEIVNDVAYMTRVVQQLLDLSRAQNFVVYNKVPVNLSALAQEVCMMLAPLALQFDKELSLDADSDTDQILADKAAVHIMIKNLVENALKHSQDNAKIQVKVTTTELEVSDNGPGIQSQYYDRLFERFWRQEQSTLTGSGLGLSIVKEVVDFHDAKLSVTCKNEQGGASFKVVFTQRNA
ncbi:ATP-binding protein [Pseudoalteromonas sp. McH1-42]|uniref:sensor histidine kinase n=1 Tax=Pseudoalteromonas sp. McH1-42 TaxID=2917752 RepID=UPI001EF64A57|nr:ATP-binding protein [Pseudoalteromonas sp. McH1-42]MCG7563078.1 ATP-binding protein [Pseudoalteromonas sp. McH1-42]